jgi:hypothetical protein
VAVGDRTDGRVTFGDAPVDEDAVSVIRAGPVPYDTAVLIVLLLRDGVLLRATDPARNRYRVSTWRDAAHALSSWAKGTVSRARVFLRAAHQLGHEGHHRRDKDQEPQRHHQCLLMIPEKELLG